jgi:hypothetical protein
MTVNGTIDRLTGDMAATTKRPKATFTGPAPACLLVRRTSDPSTSVRSEFVRH